MRRAFLCLALLAFSGCVSGAVRVERYRGAYSTHFDGIPDRSEICALVRNRSSRPVEWLELRLESVSSLADEPTSWKSAWLYRGRIEPGERVALRFENAPMADELEVSVRRIGRGGRAPLNGRPLRLARECSDEGVRALLDTLVEARETADVHVRAAARKSADAPDELVAGH